MPSKSVIRHHHPGPSAEGAAAVAAAKAAVMRVAMDGHRQELKVTTRHDPAARARLDELVRKAARKPA